MLTRRELLRYGVVTGLGMFVAACAPKATPKAAEPAGPAPTATTAAPAAAAVAPTATPVPKAPAAQPVAEKLTVTWMNWWGAQREEMMNEIIAVFEDEFPNIHVENQVQGWDNREQLAATAIASQTPPSLIMITRSEAQKFAYEDLIIPIDDYITKKGHDVYDIFIKSEIDAMKFLDKTWSYPLPGSFLDSTLWLYNKNMFRDAELDPEAPPKTWQEVDAAVEVLTTFEDGMLKTLGMTGFRGRFPSWIYCNSGKYYSDDARQLLFSQPEGIETAEWILSLVEKAGGVESEMAFMEGVSAQVSDYPFYTNTLAMEAPNVSQFGHFKTNSPDMYADTEQWGVMLVPHNGNNPAAKSAGVSGLAFTWNQVIPKGLKPELQDAAYEWLEFFTMREEGGGYFLLKQGRPSPVRRFNDNPAYYDANPYWDFVREAMDIDVGVPTTPVQIEVADILTKNLDQVWYGQKAPKEALDAAYDEAQPIVDAFWG
jgi:ABC-type glycerol-3-phosphate transport system substrate-binding protein